MAVSSQMPSGSINAVPETIKLIRPVAISINASSGNINIVLKTYIYRPVALKLKSIYIRPVVY